MSRFAFCIFGIINEEAFTFFPVHEVACNLRQATGWIRVDIITKIA